MHDREEQEAELSSAYNELVDDFVKRYGDGSASSPKIRLRLARRILGLSQKDFAIQFGLNPLTVRNWEADSRPEPTGVAQVFIDLLAADPGKLLELSRRAKKKRLANTEVETGMETID